MFAAKSVLFPKFNFCLAWNAAEIPATDRLCRIQSHWAVAAAEWSPDSVAEVWEPFSTWFSCLSPSFHIWSFSAFCIKNFKIFLKKTADANFTLNQRILLNHNTKNEHKKWNLIQFWFLPNDNNALDTNFSAWYTL